MKKQETRSHLVLLINIFVTVRNLDSIIHLYILFVNKTVCNVNVIFTFKIKC